jgi:hypothetical protein
MEAANQPAPLDVKLATSRAGRIADVFVFGLWSVLVAVVLRHHEPWADEAQAWLLARDLDLKALWFHELRYEGTPGLWHTILWIAQHWFHAPYAALGGIGMMCAAAGVAFILWKCPFPRALRYLMVFSYFIVYQYAVVARSYNLLPLLLFAAACFYRDLTHPVRMTVALILLANVSMHGTVLAASLGLCYLIEASRDWPRLSRAIRNRYRYCIAGTLLVFIFLFVILKPTPDVSEFATDRSSDLTLSKLESGAALAAAHAFLDQATLSGIFLLLACAWCFRRGKLLTFVLPVSLMVGLFIALRGRPHHVGIVFLAAIAGLWIAWPSEPEFRNGSRADRLTNLGMAVLLAWVFCVNIWDAAFAMRNDYLYPYCGAADAASYIKEVGADKTTVFGYGYGIAAVQAYFPGNILVNIPTSYYHKGFPLHGATIDFSELKAAAPEYVIVFSDGVIAFKADEPGLEAVGYQLVHSSRGEVFFKRFNVLGQSYSIFQRK